MEEAFSQLKFSLPRCPRGSLQDDKLLTSTRAMAVLELNWDRFHIVIELTSWATYAKSEMIKIMHVMLL